MHGIPYYLVLRAGHESYVLDRERVLIRRQASRMMNWFARAHAKPMSIEDARWIAFPGSTGSRPTNGSVCALTRWWKAAKPDINLRCSPTFSVLTRSGG